MGGNALKNTVISRMSLEDYNIIKEELRKVLSDHMEIEFLYDVPNKSDFGDIDILVNYGLDLKKLVTELFSPKEMYKNGNVLSFAYLYNAHYYQIDLINTRNFDSYKFYFSYGDLGNILGKIVKAYDLHFGIQGLFIEYSGKQVILSTDKKAICDYLGLDVSKWGAFNTVEEIFDWIISSRVFNKNVFGNLNQKDRRHVVNRKMYQDFVKYIEGVDLHNNNIITLKNDAIVHFDKQCELDIIDKQLAILEQRREKFNASLFIEYGYSMKELGDVIKKFKSQFESGSFEEWLDNNTKEYIHEYVSRYLQNKNCL